MAIRTKLDYTVCRNLANQAFDRALEEQKIHAVKSTSKEKQLYSIGYRRGFLEALEVLRLHGVIDIDMDK